LARYRAIADSNAFAVVHGAERASKRDVVRLHAARVSSHDGAREWREKVVKMILAHDVISTERGDALPKVQSARAQRGRAHKTNILAQAPGCTLSSRS